MRARIVDLQTSLLSSHPQVKAVKSQLADLDREIANQARLIARALEGDAKIAKVRQQELEREISRLKTATSRANEQEIKLRALEREANAQRELLETYLTRFRESTARQNSELLPVNARVISAASVPLNVHFPKPVPTLAVATFAGAFLASLFILAGELLTGRAMMTVNRQVDPSLDELDLDGFTAKANEEPSSNDVPEHGEDRGSAELANIMAGARRKSETLSERMDRSASSEDEVPGGASLSVDDDDHDETLDYVAQKQSLQLRQKAKRRKKREAGAKPVSDLYTASQAMEAIDKYQLESVAVLPVFQNRSCADFALQLARLISEAGNGVAFVDTGETEFSQDAALAGISDVINSEVSLDDVVFADPMSEVDLITSGTSELFIDDWEEGHVQSVIQELSNNYDVTVLHDPMGVRVPYFDELVEHADMVIFATNASLTRKQVATVLRENIDKVPAHSMFVGIQNADGAVAA